MLKVCSCIVALSALFVGPNCYGQLTATEELIRAEVLRLGGDWESGDSPVLVGFWGASFEQKHFEFFSHLKTVKTLMLLEVGVNAEALCYISRIDSLNRLTIEDTKFDGIGLSALSRNRQLADLTIRYAKFASNTAIGLSELTSLESLTLEDVEISAEHFKQIQNLEKLKVCTITSVNFIPMDVIETLKRSLPDCEVNVYYDPKSAKTARLPKPEKIR